MNMNDSPVITCHIDVSGARHGFLTAIEAHSLEVQKMVDERLTKENIERAFQEAIDREVRIAVEDKIRSIVRQRVDDLVFDHEFWGSIERQVVEKIQAAVGNMKRHV